MSRPYPDLQILGAAVEATKSLEGDKLGPYIHANTFKTIVGDVQFGPGGEWAKPRQFLIQFQNVKGKDPSEFIGSDRLVVVGPPELKTGDLITRFAKARQ
jgi:branched-chain amino acid transport system substrate-binding protein